MRRGTCRTTVCVQNHFVRTKVLHYPAFFPLSIMINAYFANYIVDQWKIRCLNTYTQQLYHWFVVFRNNVCVTDYENAISCTTPTRIRVSMCACEREVSWDLGHTVIIVLRISLNIWFEHVRFDGEEHGELPTKMLFNLHTFGKNNLCASVSMQLIMKERIINGRPGKEMEQRAHFHRRLFSHSFSFGSCATSEKEEPDENGERFCDWCANA